MIDAVKEAAENGLFGFTAADGNYFFPCDLVAPGGPGGGNPAEWILPVQGTIFSCATMIRLCTAPGEAVLVPAPGYNRL